MIQQLETMIAKSNKKLKAHNMKWGKDKNNNDQADIESCVVAAQYQYYIQKQKRVKRKCGVCLCVIMFGDENHLNYVW